MDLSLTIRITFFIVYFGIGLLLFVTTVKYFQKLRKINKRPDSGFSDFLYYKRTTTEESEMYYHDLFSKNLKNNKLRKEILAVRFSFIIAFLTFFVGIILFNIY